MSRLPSTSVDDVDLQHKTSKTKTESVTERLEALVSSSALFELIRPSYFVHDRRDRQPCDLELMLRVHLLQIVYNMRAPQMEDFLLENHTARNFVGLQFIDRPPNKSTILYFRHFLKEHVFGKTILELISDHFNTVDLILCKGRITDASFIESPTSTKNRTHSWNPEMSCSKKGTLGISVRRCILSPTTALASPRTPCTVPLMNTTS